MNRQDVLLTVIGLPIGLIAGFLVSWMLFPAVIEFFSYTALTATEMSVSPLIFVIAALFTVLTVFISTRKPAKKAAKVSPLEAIRYTGQENIKKKATKRSQGAKLPRMALANLGRSKRRTVFIIISMLLCIVLLNSAFVITQSIDEDKFISRQTKTDYTVYNSTSINFNDPFQYHEDGLPLGVPELINQQSGVENGRYLYRNTLDDADVTVDYGIEGIEFSGTHFADELFTEIVPRWISLRENSGICVAKNLSKRTPTSVSETTKLYVADILFIFVPIGALFTMRQINC